jgi:hypothetical protein
METAGRLKINGFEALVFGTPNVDGLISMLHLCDNGGSDPERDFQVTFTNNIDRGVVRKIEFVQFV